MKQMNTLKNNKGFTLVELIVVVVILLILAGLMIPAFTKYFSKKYDEKKKEELNNLFDASQIYLYDLYANNSHSDDDNCIIPGKPDNGGDPKKAPATYKFTNSETEDCDIHWSTLSDNILKNVGLSIRKNEPCVVIMCTGSYEVYNNPFSTQYDPQKAYTVYMMMYQSVYGDKVFYQIKGDDDIKINKCPVKSETIEIETETGPKKKKKNYIILPNNEKVYVQYFSLKNGKDNNSFLNNLWNYIKKWM